MTFFQGRRACLTVVKMMNEFEGKTIESVHYECCKCGGSIVLVRFADGTAVWITDGEFEYVEVNNEEISGQPR